MNILDLFNAINSIKPETIHNFSNGIQKIASHLESVKQAAETNTKVSSQCYDSVQNNSVIILGLSERISKIENDISQMRITLQSGVQK